MGAIIAAALAASAIACLTTPGAASAAVGDAYCSGPPTNVAGIADHDGARWGQTFSPINGGFLSEVRLFVQEEVHSNDTLQVQITPVNSSDLSPVFPVTPLATATVADSSLTPNANFPNLVEVAFDFPNPPAVLASSEYTIVLTRTDTSGVLGIGVVGTGSPPDPCPDGELYGGPATASPWGAPLANDDMVFTTFVGGAPTPPPPAAATGKRAAALAKCKKKHSHKAKKKCKKKANQLPV
ncbi:MAG: hypothetical protein QOD60_1473 [Solirubrobacterales bacterium]|nr:hypothetical protein [Solirubrobacterales bacterium]